MLGLENGNYKGRGKNVNAKKHYDKVKDSVYCNAHSYGKEGMYITLFF